MKKITAMILAGGFWVSSNVALGVVIPGFSDVIDNGGGSYTFTFDTLTGGDIVNADGLSFSGVGSPLLTVTQFGGTAVIQDLPDNGGLGTDGGGFGDNMGAGDGLTFGFSSFVSLTNITFNGLLNSNGHTDAASGLVNVAGTVIDTDSFDGVGDNGALAPGFFSGTSFDVTTIDSLRGFHGYVESITVQTRRKVPESTTIALLGLGMVALGLARRKR